MDWIWFPSSFQIVVVSACNFRTEVECAVRHRCTVDVVRFDLRMRAASKQTEDGCSKTLDHRRANVSWRKDVQKSYALVNQELLVVR